MIPGEFTGFHYPYPENSIPFPVNIGMMQQPQQLHQANVSDFDLVMLLNSLQPSCITSQTVHDFTIQSSSLSNNSTSDEAEVSVIDERKQRRMISNRESARRSRIRKQKHLDELRSQVARLRTENHNLIDKLNHVSESHERVLQENARLKEEASDLRRMLTDLQIGSPFTASTLRDLDEIPCNTAHLRAESSNITNSSLDLLQ